MHIDPYIVLGSAVVGFLVGLTGAGGGALMTPMLILLFGVKPSTAISSDLVAAVFMRPFGAAVHISKRTVNFRLVGWMVLGSVPMAFVGCLPAPSHGPRQDIADQHREAPGGGPADRCGGDGAAVLPRPAIGPRPRRPSSTSLRYVRCRPCSSAWSAGSSWG